MTTAVFPAYLEEGDCIGIAATARSVQQSELQACISWLEAAGFRVKLASNIGSVWHQFAGTDEERANALQSLLDDGEVKAILCARGGYGTVRILDKLDWTTFLEKPKWICGYSDVTALHAALNRMGIASLHCDMALGFAKKVRAFQAFLQVLRGNRSACILPQDGLAGGNLSVLYSLLGSKDFPDVKGRYLFLEDLDEYLYHIDRMMLALWRSGKLSEVKAVYLGGFTEMKDNTVPFGFSPEACIRSYFEPAGIRVYGNILAGHIEENMPIVFS